MRALEKLLDSRFKRVIHTGSATWCKDKVWIVYSTDGIINSCNGLYIHKYESDCYSLVERFDDGETEWAEEIHHYRIGDGGLRHFLETAQNLLTEHKI